jgi:hypothetical protein
MYLLTMCLTACAIVTSITFTGIFSVDVVFNATLSTLGIPVNVMLVAMAHAVKHMVSRYILQT